MSEPQTQLPAVQAKNEIEFKPFGSDDAIRLSLNVIKTYVAVPAHDRNTKEEITPDERECMRFMMLCRTQRLNPFAGDAFMVPFWDSRENRHKWNLITGITAFYKRAELHPEFDGIESGVIVEDELGEIAYLEGDFIPDGQKCVGGWATVFFKNRSHPMKKKVKLSTYQKTFGVWMTDAPGMICKVAEAQGLRDAFPTMLGGMYLREEYTDVPAEVVESREIRRPDFAHALPPVSIDQQGSRRTEKTAPVPPGGKPAGTKIEPDKAPAASQDAPKPPEGKKPASTPSDAAATPPAKETPPQNAPAEPPTPPAPAEPANTTPAEDEKALQEAGLAPETQGQKPPEEAPPAGDPGLSRQDGDTDAIASIKLQCSKAAISWPQLKAWLFAKRLLKEGQRDMRDMATSKVESLNRVFGQKIVEIRSYKDQ